MYVNPVDVEVQDLCLMAARLARKFRALGWATERENGEHAIPRVHRVVFLRRSGLLPGCQRRARSAACPPDVACSKCRGSDALPHGTARRNSGCCLRVHARRRPRWPVFDALHPAEKIVSKRTVANNATLATVSLDDAQERACATEPRHEGLLARVLRRKISSWRSYGGRTLDSMGLST